MRLRFLLVLSTFVLVASSALAQVTHPVAFVSLPFDLMGGLVVLRNLELNGQHGDFILDTGSNYGLVVERAAFASQLQGAVASGLGAGSTLEVQRLRVTSFQFGATHYTGLQAMATSLMEVRRFAGPRLLGFIGTELLRDYEVVIDYAHRQVSCYPLRAGKTPKRLPFTRTDSLHFTLLQGKPLAQGYIGKTPVRLLLDTGATSNSLDAAFVQQLAPELRPRLLGSTQPFAGVGSGAQQAPQAILSELRLPPTAWRELPVMLVKFARPVSGLALPYQGILGYVFLAHSSQSGVISFHYGRQQFYWLTPRRPSR
ncbi:aspartyl protease family protein [Hymenobacter sp. BT559]|uniref:aspartyl protease family protein n=1 Tax=Hymenobacter sp. BT559 TaxID=2795729 RepID=UPI0018EAC028|nr:aspartyl protease family protein [Hymenobacter sp. BT559]MBJ6141763.1 aspartyl protease family protein [Hymenobacter sp. BT559]